VVEVKCQVVDEKVQEVLKFLCTFNICKWTNDILDALYISEIFVSNVGTEASNKLRYVFKKHWMFQVHIEEWKLYTVFSGAGLAWGTKVNSVQWTSIFHKFLYKNYFPQNCVEVFKLISFVLVETQYFQFLLLLKFVLVDKFDWKITQIS
jgi:hypothetical protein